VASIIDSYGRQTLVTVINLRHSSRKVSVIFPYSKEKWLYKMQLKNFYIMV